MMTGMPPEMQAMMAQFPMTPEMMFGGMGMMPDPSAFAQQPGFGGFPQPPSGPSGQQNFGGGYGGFPQQMSQQPPQQGYGQQQYGGQPQQQSQQLQPPKFPGQRVGSPARIGSPNTFVSFVNGSNFRNMNIPSGPQAMTGQQGYYGNTNVSMRGAPRGAPRRGY
jgi:hypothetical protein